MKSVPHYSRQRSPLGQLAPTPDGTRLAWQQLIEASLQYSNNTAHKILYDTITTDSSVITPQQILQYLQFASYDQLLKYQSPHPIASKYGIDINQGVYNEAGIVYLPQFPYLLSVLIQSK
jgi:beta-lactamase class A